MDLVYARCPPPNEVTAETRRQLEERRGQFQQQLDDALQLVDMLERRRDATTQPGTASR